MDFKSYKTPNGSLLLCDFTNDFAYLLTDLAPQLSASNGIKVIAEKPSQMVGSINDYEIYEESIGGYTTSILNNIKASADQTSAALATYLLTFQSL